jgi:ubiquitin-protein ligase
MDTKNKNIVSALTTKRITGELKNLEKNREAYYQVVQDKNNPLLFYFLLRGASDSSYKNGYYIGKIVLPSDYPTNPGDFYMLTPSGRFKVNEKICLTNSSYHKESWSPMWNIKNMVIGFLSVFLSDDTTGISHIKETQAERHEKAKNSMAYNLKHHKDICLKFDQYMKADGTVRTDQELNEYIKSFKDNSKPVKKLKVVKTTDADDKNNDTVDAPAKVEPVVAPVVVPAVEPVVAPVKVAPAVEPVKDEPIVVAVEPAVVPAVEPVKVEPIVVAVEPTVPIKLDQPTKGDGKKERKKVIKIDSDKQPDDQTKTQGRRVIKIDSDKQPDDQTKTRGRRVIRMDSDKQPVDHQRGEKNKKTDGMKDDPIKMKRSAEYQKWRQLVDQMTIETHDPKILCMF